MVQRELNTWTVVQMYCPNCGTLCAGYDDITVRRLVDCIQICGNQKIIVTLKGGYQAEERLRKREAVSRGASSPMAKLHVQN